MKSSTTTILYILGLSGVIVFLKWKFGILICDDAYITLAHVENWIENGVPMASVHNQINATSTPLYCTLLYLISLIIGVGGLEYITYFLNQFADVVALVYLYKINRHLENSNLASLWIVTAYGLSTSFFAISASGMETPLYVAMILVAYYYGVVNKRPRVMLFLFLIIPAIRPEASLIILTILLHNFVVTKRIDWKAIAAFVVGMMYLFGFYLWSHGLWVPHSVVAKQHQLKTELGDALYTWIINVFYKGPVFGGFSVTTAVNLVLLGVCCYGLYKVQKFKHLAILIFPTMYFLFFIITKSSYILFTWYYLPVFPLVLTFLGVGLHRVLELIPPKLGASLLVLFVLVVLVQNIRTATPENHQFAHQMREKRYFEIVEYIQSIDPTGDIMIDEVGVFVYAADQKILDIHGLISHDLIPIISKPLEYNQRMIEIKKEFQPQWIVQPKLVAQESTREPFEEELYEGYTLLKRFNHPEHIFHTEVWRLNQPR